MLVRSLVARTVLLRAIKCSAIPKQSTRNSGHGVWSYRTPPPLPSKFSRNLATGLGGLVWWWIFYHIFTEPDHITGEFPYIDPITYTDEELGIPPDSEGPLKN